MRPRTHKASKITTTAPSGKTKVVIADRERAVCGLLVSYLSGNGKNLEIAGLAHSGRETLALCRSASPALLILDTSFDDVVPASLVREIRGACPDVRIIAFTRWMETEAVRRMIEAGIHGIVFKESPLDVLAFAIAGVSEGGCYFDSHVGSLLQPGRDAKGQLSEREAEVLRLIAEGFLTKEIAASLSLSIKTVEKYRERVMSKLNLHDVVKLTHYAIRNGLVALRRAVPLAFFFGLLANG